MIIQIGNERYEIKYTEDPFEIERAIEEHEPSWITYDTETDGLHLKKCRPFLGDICFYTRDRADVDGIVYIFPTVKGILRYISKWARMVSRLYAHNTVFDANMTANIVGDEIVNRITNWGDTMGVCRLTFEAVPSNQGGDSLKLKVIGKKYIDPEYNRYEKEVKAWLKQKVSMDRKILVALIRGQGWTMKRFEAALNDGTEEIPSDILEIFHTWRREYPEPNYTHVPEDIMYPYIAVDAIGCNILIKKGLPVLESKRQLAVMDDEFNLIPVIFRMSRIGMPVDRPYLLESLERVSKYIEELEAKMYYLTGGREITVNQHAKLKELYGEMLGFMPESTDKFFMRKQRADGDLLAAVIIKLRTLEKWKSTYIERILENSEYDGRFYSTLDQFNPITGRFSGDMQQMPKAAITYDLIEVPGCDVPAAFEVGTELFYPRKAILTDIDQGYKMFLMDFSQVELRFQAHYTIPFGGDMNLCRAYMPFKCVHYVTGEEYNYEDYDARMRWNELKPEFDVKDFDRRWTEQHPNSHWEFSDICKEGWSVWVIPEDGSHWHPTDVHTLSTRKALDIMGLDWQGMTEKAFKVWRGLGKSFNFMRNYGGGAKKAAAVLDITLDQGRAMADGYTESFPTVVTYQKSVEKALYQRGFVQGIYGRRYYLTDTWRFYKAANYLIQGSCAHDLKLKMVILDKLFEGKKSYMVMCVHDEIIYRIHESEMHLVPEIKAIMEYTPKIRVPIVSEVDYTTTNWAEKHKWEGIA